MSQHYSDVEKENEPMSLPDLEVWREPAIQLECTKCGADYSVPQSHGGVCDCGTRMTIYSGLSDVAPWWFWYCLPGCLPDSEVNGPYDSEEEALEDARAFSF